MIEPSPLPGDPTELHLRFVYADMLSDTPHADTLEEWRVEVLHRRRTHDDSRCPIAPSACEADHCPAYTLSDSPAGSMTFFRVHLDRGRNAHAALADESEDLNEIAQDLLAPATGYFTDEVSVLLECSGSARRWTRLRFPIRPRSPGCSRRSLSSAGLTWRRSSDACTAEVIHLRLDQCHLPKAEWGLPNLSGGVVTAGQDWTDDGAMHEVHSLKRRAATATRPCDLRRAGISFWLYSGVDPAECARRAGQSIEVLFRFYAKFLDGVSGSRPIA
ncbi:hypothetical protein DWB77_06874 [Streptomyces hundungensis]|uniref:Uncharacterized protein n=1 Tax=Streptomyces hundungensis TaxID=1077946 RepID=A0A387HRU7_9ACTN|nr:hypothetical protein DWB77_06874 [Streptomyces hundungensis]